MNAESRMRKVEKMLGHPWAIAALVAAFSIILTPVLCGEKASREGVETRGNISGIVTDLETGDPVAGAFVRVDHSGDAGGTNLGRFRQKGTYVTDETDAEGRFVLEGVAFDDKHPFHVTCSGYVRHERTVALREEKPDIEVVVGLKPAGRIVVTVGSEEEPIPREGLSLRLTARDGRLLSPMKEHRYPYRVEMVKERRTAVFDDLDAGIFAVEAIQIGPSEAVYRGRASNIKVQAGRTRTARIEGPVSQTRATIRVAEDPLGGERAGEPSHRGEEQSRKAVIAVVSRQPGLLLWSTGKYYHPEDPRLGRIMSMGLLLPVTAGSDYSLVDLPPGTYSVLTITIGNYTGQTRGPTGAYVRGAGLEISSQRAASIDIPWTEPTGPSDGRAYRGLNGRVSLGPGQQTVRDLCRSLIGVRVVPDPAIQNEPVALHFDQAPLWDILETLHLAKGWVVMDDGRQGLVLRPGQ